MTPLIATFKTVKFLYPKLVSAGFTNRHHKYHMLDYKTPPSEITLYGHLRYAHTPIKVGNDA